MIEGLKFHFKTEDLAAKIRARSAYHRDRAATKEAEVPKLKEAMDAIKNHAFVNDAAKIINSSAYHSEDPVKDLERDIRTHKASAAKFDQFADHLAPSEVYVLSVSDMQALELIR